MSDQREIIRQQMDETKSQLSDKLQLLKVQIAETARSTGTAVNSTVEAVKDTVETVQSAAKSVRNTFNVRRRISMHPWLVLGACTGLGYLAGRRRRARPASLAGALPSRMTNQPDAATGTHPSDATAITTAIAAAYQKGLKNSSWDLLRSTAIAAAIEIVQDIAFRVAPKLLDRLTAIPAEIPSGSSQARCADQASEAAPLPAGPVPYADRASQETPPDSSLH